MALCPERHRRQSRTHLAVVKKDDQQRPRPPVELDEVPLGQEADAWDLPGPALAESDTVILTENDSNDSNIYKV